MANSDFFSIFAKNPTELSELLGLEKTFQGKQVYQWAVKGVESFDAMTNLPKVLRERLSNEHPSTFSSKVLTSQTDDDGAAKLALELFDGNIVECVLLTDKEGELTACVSSQVGCAMGCRFCRTGTLKLKRNLKDFEIVEQFMHLQNVAPGKISHVVFMGMGEPFANLENVLSAITFLHDPEGLNLSHRRITISTCGVVPGINELARRKVPVKLAVSLVTADDEKRSSLMPVNRAYPLKELRDALVRFQKVSGRRFTFEYCMIHDMNIAEEDADKLARFCRSLEVIVNLIPFNPCPELPYETPTDSEIRFFTNALTRRGVEYTIRISRGRSIRGACGQLAGKIEENR
jgi:23S rRNA (adenine2503-C2)-methyltransferase